MKRPTAIIDDIIITNIIMAEYSPETRKKAVLEHMGNLTDEAPGPEIGRRRFQLVQVVADLRRRERLSADSKRALDAMQREWGSHYGRVMQGNRSLKAWCKQLWRLREVKMDLLFKESNEGLSDPEVEQLRVADSVTSFCLEQLNNTQRQWGNEFGNEWTQPRSIGKWSQDLYKNEKLIKAKKKEKKDLEDELNSFGWSTLRNKFYCAQSPFWLVKHKEILGEPLFNFDDI